MLRQLPSALALRRADDQDHNIHEGPSHDWSRRDFVALSVAAGLAATVPALAAELPVIETAQATRSLSIRRPVPMRACWCGRMRWVYGLRCMTSASASRLRGTRCWCQTRSIERPRPPG